MNECCKLTVFLTPVESSIFANFPEAWIKGTISGSTVTFSDLQYQGIYSDDVDYPMYSIGSSDGQTLDAFRMDYDAEAHTLTSQNYLVLNASTAEVYCLEAYSDIVISKDPLPEEEATTADPVEAPYSNELTTADLFADFGVIDSNEDGSTWTFETGSGTRYKWNSSNDANDWLISPAIKLEAGKQYRFAIDAYAGSTSWSERLEVLMGTEAKASALTQRVLAATDIIGTDPQTYENANITVQETGYYHFGVHAISDKDKFYLYVKNFIVEQGAEAEAPSAVTDFTAVATEGALEVTVNFTAPTTTISGASLASLTKIDLLRDGQVIKTFEGSEGPTATWVAADQGYENSEVVDEFEIGTGLTATLSEGTNTQNSPKYYTTGTAVRMYGGNTLTIAGTSTITKIVFTFDTSKTPAFDVEPGTFDAETYTWTGEATNIVFTVPSVSGQQTRIQKIQVWTESTPGTVTSGVAPGATVTYVDNEGLTMGKHSYQVIPYNEAGMGTKSDIVEVTLNAVSEVPFFADFSDQSVMNLFEVIDANEDGKTWGWSSDYNANYSYSSTNAADDYLISTPIHLVPGKSYSAIVNAQAYNASYTESFEVLVGQAPTVAGLTITAIGPTDVTSTVAQDFDGEFSVTEEGNYYVAIHAISAADQWRLIVNSLSIEAGAEAGAPAAVSDLVATAGAEGALEANLSFTVPSTAIDGTALTSNVDMKIYRDNVLVATLTGLTPGSSQTWKDTNVEDGETYTYYVVAANEAGDGQKSDKVTVLVGQDKLDVVDGIQITGSTASTISFSWNEVAGVNGGYVNTAEVIYAVVSCHVETSWFWDYLVVDEVLGTVTGQTSGTFNYNVDAGEQDFVYFGVAAVKNESQLPAAGDEYDGGYTWALVGAPYELPFAESFTGGNVAYGTWNLDSDADNYTGLFVSDASDDDRALFITTIEDPGYVRLVSGRIKLSGQNPTLKFDAKGDGLTSAKVYASVDDGEWTVIKTIEVTDAYQTFQVPLFDKMGQRFTRFAIGADIVNPAIYMGYDPQTYEDIYEYHDGLYIDNILVKDLLDYNLVAGIKAPAKVTAGQSARVDLSVLNDGTNDVEGMTVKITANDKEVYNQTLDLVLLAGQTWDDTFTFETTVFDEPGDVTLTVTVETETDLNPDDNSASTIIKVVAPTVPGPTDFTATNNETEGGVDLTWTAPETSGAVVGTPVTESFEEGLGGFTTIDADGDGYNWTYHINTGTGNHTTNTGDGVAYSESYSNDAGSALTPDNWLVTPLASLDGTFSFYACGQDANYVAEHFAVYVSTTVADDPSAFEQVSEEFIATASMTEYTVDLSAYAGQAGYIAIRHFNVTDMFVLNVDDVTYLAVESAAPALRGAVTVASYNIYVESQLLAGVSGEETTYHIATDKVSNGEHTFGVTAVYSNGVESLPVTKTIEVTTATAIEQIIANGKPVDVYSLDGKLVRQQTRSLSGLKGVYVINGKTMMIK